MFTTPGDIHFGPVSVVGLFNDWTPGEHVLEPQSDGTISVRVAIDPNTDIDTDFNFRYLGSGGVWFDDPDPFGHEALQ